MNLQLTEADHCQAGRRQKPQHPTDGGNLVGRGLPVCQQPVVFDLGQFAGQFAEFRENRRSFLRDDLDGAIDVAAGDQPVKFRGNRAQRLQRRLDRGQEFLAAFADD